ncbi:MAG TPA: serine/threonine-protein kinase [Labilithrix sp.]|nr:serine/threonine-protein kinase [Labilithrix sp.]
MPPASYTLVNEDEALVGTIIGERYHLREILGQGGTGTVFAAEHLSFGRAAAMKVLRPRYTSRESVQRVFQLETRAALAVTHPSLCEVFDIGTLPDGAPFFVMDRLDGETLAVRIARERFSAAAAVDLTMQLLSAMDALHERQLVLRDLRPHNVFLAHRRGCRPVVKLLDVGLARLMPLDQVRSEWDALRAVTSASDVSGLLSVPYYLSPERARGEQGEVAGDLFVAGIILYEALTGQKPFAATSWDGLIQQIRGAEPTALEVLRPDLPGALGELLERSLSADPRARPPSAREMQDELRSVFDGPKRPSGAMRAEPNHTDVTVAARVDVDEASADHPVRTLRPPAAEPGDGAIDVEVDIEEPALTTRSGRIEEPEEEEETATMELTPALRERIEQMATPSRPPGREESSSRPPPTRPLRPPRRR